jgi:hypothetical protein
LKDTQTVYNNVLAQPKQGTRMLFCMLWVFMFILYYPAAKAGFVTDFTGWLDQVKNHGFWEHINRTNFHAKSLYQFTQFNTYVFYKLLGIHPWLWHLLFITLHVCNACLLFKLCIRLLGDAGAENGNTISLWGVLLFCVTPYISEVVVWEPSFHFLQGLLLILLILIWTQQYIYTGQKKYALYACIVYLLSTFSLEMFYVTPWLVLTLALFYRFLPSFDKKAFSKVVLYFFLPMLLLFVLRFIAYRMVYGDWVSRIGSAAVTSVPLKDLGKPIKYLFHLLLLGRFFPDEFRNRIYGVCEALNVIIAFYGAIAIIFAFIIFRFRRMDGKARVASLLFIWSLITVMLLVPLAFGNQELVIYDRYTYFAGAFFYMLLAVMVAFIEFQYVRIGVIAFFALANLRFAIQLSRYWGKAERVDHALLTNIPPLGNKTLVLLNLPESMNGLPMIGSDKESEFKFMHNLLFPESKIDNTVYDVLSYNLLTPDNGAQVNVVNDSLLHVTLNQFGTWWWFAGKGGYSYENKDYRLNLVDPGHWYEITLKKPAKDYVLLYQVGDQWKVVDMNKKGIDQK